MNFPLRVDSTRRPVSRDPKQEVSGARGCGCGGGSGNTGLVFHDIRLDERAHACKPLARLAARTMRANRVTRSLGGDRYPTCRPRGCAFVSTVLNGRRIFPARNYRPRWKQRPIIRSTLARGPPRLRRGTTRATRSRAVEVLFGSLVCLSSFGETS